MAITTEVGRLVVRMVGDSSSYDRMLQKAEAGAMKLERVQKQYDAQRLAARERYLQADRQMFERHQLELSRIPANQLQKRLQVEERQLLQTQHLKERYLQSELVANRTHAMNMAQVTEDQMRQSAQAAADNARIMVQVFAGAFATISALSIKAFADFDQAMTKSTAVFEKLTPEMENDLQKKVFDVSSRNVHGPQELAKVYYEFATSGRSAKEAMASLETVSRFATAGAFNVERASNLLLRAQNALGMFDSSDAEASAANMTRLANSLVAAGNISQATVEELSQSLTNHFGASLRVVNKSLEEGLALLSVYSKEQQGLIAGSTGSRLIRLLGTPANTAAAGQRRKELGFNIFDRQGQMKSFADIVKNLEEILRGMSDELKLATLEELGFEARIQHAILPLIGNSKAIAENYEKIKQMKNVMEEMYQKQMQSFSNQMSVLKNKITIMAIEIGKMLVPAVKSLSAEVENLTSWWNGLNPGVKSFIASIGKMLILLGPVYILIRSITGIVAGLAFMRGGAGVINMTRALDSWRLALAAGIVVAIELGKALNDNIGGMKEYNAELERSKEISKSNRDAVQRNRDVRLANKMMIENLVERKKAIQDMLTAEEKLAKDQEANIDRLEKKEAKMRPKLPSVFGQQLTFSEGNPLVDIFTDKGEDLPGWKLVKEELDDAKKRFVNTKQFIDQLKREVKFDPFEEAKRQLDELAKSIKGLNADLDREFKILGMTSEEAKIYDFQTQLQKQFVDGLRFSLIDLNRLLVLSAELENARVKSHRLDVIKEAEKTAKEFGQSVKQLNDSLQEQVDTFGMASHEVELYKLQMKELAMYEQEGFMGRSGIGWFEKMMIRQNIVMLAALERRKELTKKGEDLTKEFLDPSEKLRLRIEELSEVLNFGSIGMLTYVKAIDEVVKSLYEVEKAHKAAHAAATVNQAGLFSAEAMTRMQQQADMLRGDRVRNRGEKVNRRPGIPFGGIFGNGLNPARMPEGGWGMGGAPAGGWPLLNKLFPEATGWKVGPLFQQGEEMRPTNNGVPINRQLGENSPIHKTLIDIKTAIVRGNSGRPVVEVETADLT